MTAPINPFFFESPADRWAFTDREELLPVLQSAMAEQGRRVLLYGRRRMGKTSLVQNAARKAKAELLYVDLSTASDLTEAANKLLQAVPEAGDRPGRPGDEAGEKAFQGHRDDRRQMEAVRRPAAGIRRGQPRVGAQLHRRLRRPDGTGR